MDRRIRKKADADGVGPASPTYAWNVYQGDNPLLEIADSDGLGSGVNPSVAHRYLYAQAVDEILASENATGVLWGLGDHEGTIRDIANNSGTLVDHRRYDSFGKLTAETAAATDFIFGYTGQPLDKDTGLYDMGHRWYDVTVGRFASEDPTGFSAGDMNLYRYVGNNPMNLTDPTGLCGVASYTGFDYTGAGRVGYSPDASPSFTPYSAMAAPVRANTSSAGVGGWFYEAGANFAQGSLTLSNGATNFVVHVDNLGIFALNLGMEIVNDVASMSNYRQAVFSAPIPYFEAKDWSRNKIRPEPDWVHDLNIQGGEMYATLGAGALANYVGAANTTLAAPARVVAPTAIGEPALPTRTLTGTMDPIPQGQRIMIRPIVPSEGMAGTTVQGAILSGEGKAPMTSYTWNQVLQARYGAANVTWAPPKLPSKPLTLGVLRTPAGDFHLASGWNGYAPMMPKGAPGFDIVTRTHVEGGAAALMQRQGIREGVLYINNPEICGSCTKYLPRMLQPGRTLQVVLPDGKPVPFTGSLK